MSEQCRMALYYGDTERRLFQAIRTPFKNRHAAIKRAMEHVVFSNKMKGVAHVCATSHA